MLTSEGRVDLYSLSTSFTLSPNFTILLPSFISSESTMHFFAVVPDVRIGVRIFPSDGGNIAQTHYISGGVGIDNLLSNVIFCVERGGQMDRAHVLLIVHRTTDDGHAL